MITIQDRAKNLNLLSLIKLGNFLILVQNYIIVLNWLPQHGFLFIEGQWCRLGFSFLPFSKCLRFAHFVYLPTSEICHVRVSTSSLPSSPSSSSPSSHYRHCVGRVSRRRRHLCRKWRMGRRRLLHRQHFLPWEVSRPSERIRKTVPCP